jgi:hypothetical protein
MENSVIYLVWTCLDLCFIREDGGLLNVGEFDFENLEFVGMHMDSHNVGMGCG